MDVTLDAASSKPLYEQIKEFVLSGIQTGMFKPHSRIPSERDLAQRFGVSRLTVTKALKELEQAGVVYVRIGKGTFIEPEVINLQLDTLMSFTEEMTQRGQAVSSRVMYAQVNAASKDIAQKLSILVGTQVVTLQRLRLTNGQPIALETSTLLAACCHDILDHHNFAKESLYHVLRTNYHIVLTYAEQTIEARQASRDEARALEIKEGDPILAIYRVTHNEHDKPIEYVSSVYRGDRYKFRAILRNI
ncbi:MAG: GntR family transcriptional regulator [Chitinophagaceae bacterium]|nr:GntR family transcriptional regulator [Anaerolineae bacterium]